MNAQQELPKLSQEQELILDKIFERLGVSKKYLKESPKLVFDSVEVMTEQLNKVSRTQNKQKQIKDKANIEIRKLESLGFEDVKDIGSRGIKLVKGVGKAALGIKLVAVNLTIPFVSDLISESGGELLGDGFSNIGEAVFGQSNKKQEITVLVFIVKKLYQLILQNDEIILLANKCLKNPKLRKRLYSQQKFKSLLPKLVAALVLYAIVSPVIRTIFPEQESTVITSSSNAQEIKSQTKIPTQNVKLSNPEIETVSQDKPEKEQVLNNLDTANLEAAKEIAMEASILVQSPPHPIEVWQQAQTKWQESINLLETIPENSLVYAQAQEKLATYQNHYSTITGRILIEQTAAENFEVAQQLAWEAAVLVQNPPHPVEVWLEAQSKIQQAIDLLENIPEGTLVESKAEEKLTIYQGNYEAVTTQIARISESQ